MKRPFVVTLAGWMVLIFTAWNVLRAWTSIAWSSTLTEFALRLSPAASAFIGIFWAALGAALSWSIWQKKPWSAKFLIGAGAGSTVWYWSERFLFQNPRPNSLFAVIVNLAVLTIIFFASKSLSREAYERNTENPTTE
ncbi:MAG: hypothetical protein DPW18_05665 [Chloroflexi bacterium]|nr:hypothetical protein [Chloroflexota bacterium]MDL1942459.1 hypothetical protein [Chloroflexi bacterium CFX2]